MLARAAYSPAVRPAGPPPMMMRSRSVSSGILSGRSSPRLEQLIIPERFLALGDSFTIGTGTTPDRSFPAVLARIWTERGRKVVLANPAVNGYTTDDLISDELPLVSSFHPTLITVLVGANDIVRGDSEDRYRRQLRSIYERIRAIARAIERFNAIARDEAERAGASWVDLFPLMREQGQKKMFAADGLHPSAEAYAGWASELGRAL
ncbi:MAG: SGNH/GDSL hydrolase family protein [Chloroflexi bacterium]|nr:MAG: SGNH/GDSL hydrolase family protein [Chloroflexota bacterium]